MWFLWSWDLGVQGVNADQCRYALFVCQVHVILFLLVSLFNLWASLATKEKTYPCWPSRELVVHSSQSNPGHR